MNALVGLCLLLASDPCIELDYTKLPRVIAKEPKYIAQPRYALFILDPGGRFRAWAVLDKSKRDQPYYDVLYFDRDGNGDLTQPGTRFVGQYDAKSKSLAIAVGDLRVPDTHLKHTDLKFGTLEPHGYKGFWFSMKWAGEIPVEGGYATGGEELTEYGVSPSTAPILRPGPMGRLSFISWDRELTLPIGKSKNVQLGIGSRGWGANTFCALSEHYLTPGKDVLIATLIARARDGSELRVPTTIKKHC